MPIVDDRGGVLGLVTSRDDDIGSRDPASEPRPGAQALSERLRTLTALDIGAPDPVSVDPATPARVTRIIRTDGIQQAVES